MTGRVNRWLSLLLLVGAVGPQAHAQAHAQEDGEKIYQRTLRATVWIISAREGNKMATGTGSIIDTNRRLVLTNYHVVGDEAEVFILYPIFRHGKLVAERRDYLQIFRQGGAKRARVLARDMKHDLALVELDAAIAGTNPLRLAKQSPSPGQRVHSIGNPGDTDALWEYTSGTVRAVYHKQWEVRDGGRSLSFNAEVVETQSPTNRGDSGGPLVNDRGDLVAVTQGYNAAGQLLSLFVDVTEVKSFLAAKHLIARLPTSSALETATTTKVKTEAESPVVAVDPEQEASRKLSSAKLLVEAGRLERAKDRCEKIISDFPTTKAAGEAKLLLDKLNK